MLLPGQKIRFAVSKSRKDKAEGRLLEVLERSEKEGARQTGRRKSARF